MKKIFFSLFLVLLFASRTNAENVWINDLRKLFLDNNAIIYEINMRTFAAQDINKDGIIETSEGEESGNFLNAIGRLDEIQAAGINTLHLMPVTPVGKTKALGSAGSLYAASSFNELNPQLKSNRTMLSLESQAIKFINEAHRRKIRIIVDLPSCGSYDLYTKQPDLFAKGTNGDGIIPADWTDVRLFDSGDEISINQNVYDLYKGFVDYVIFLGADGIRADAAHTKPAKFWKELISYSRKKDPQFMWLAESSDSWTQPVSPKAVFTPYNKLLEAGFDGFYGSFFKMKDWRSASELEQTVKNTVSMLKGYSEPKAVIGSFTTHDEISPILINGSAYSEMIAWLNATLPLNSYFVDGFPTGDSYIYLWGNKKARKTYTDNDLYFVHRGKIDIFNFSRKPGGKESKLEQEFIQANNFKTLIAPMITNGRYTYLKTTNKKIFAYAISYNKSTVLVFGNIDFKSKSEGTVKVPHYKNELLTVPIKLYTTPISNKGKFTLNMAPGEIQVLLVNEFEI